MHHLDTMRAVTLLNLTCEQLDHITDDQLKAHASTEYAAICATLAAIREELRIGVTDVDATQLKQATYRAEYLRRVSQSGRQALANLPRQPRRSNRAALLDAQRAYAAMVADVQATVEQAAARRTTLTPAERDAERARIEAEADELFGS